MGEREDDGVLQAFLGKPKTETRAGLASKRAAACVTPENHRHSSVANSLSFLVVLPLLLLLLLLLLLRRRRRGWFVSLRSFVGIHVDERGSFSPSLTK